MRWNFRRCCKIFAPRLADCMRRLTVKFRKFRNIQTWIWETPRTLNKDWTGLCYPIEKVCTGYLSVPVKRFQFICEVIYNICFLFFVCVCVASTNLSVIFTVNDANVNDANVIDESWWRIFNKEACAVKYISKC